MKTLCHQGSYYYEVKELYFLAIQNIIEAIKINPESQILKIFYPGNFYGQTPPSYNMYGLLEENVAEYKSLPEAVKSEDFVNNILETVRNIRSKILEEK